MLWRFRLARQKLAQDRERDEETVTNVKKKYDTGSKRVTYVRYNLLISKLANNVSVCKLEYLTLFKRKLN